MFLGKGRPISRDRMPQIHERGGIADKEHRSSGIPSGVERNPGRRDHRTPRIGEPRSNSAISLAHAGVHSRSGLKFVEAMACGTPVVASDIPGHRDSVPEGVGIRVPYGDVRATAAAATRLLQSDGHYEHPRQEGLLWSQRQS